MSGYRSWAVAVQLRPGRLTFAGQLGSAHTHAHAAVQLLLVTSGEVLLADDGGSELPVQAAVIPAGAAHAVRADQARGVMVYLDAAGRQARGLTARLAQVTEHATGVGNSHACVAAWQAAARPALAVLTTLTVDITTDLTAGLEASGGVVAALTGQGDPVAPPQGGGLHTALAMLPELVATGEPIRLEAVAAQVGLSASRLRHLFTEQLGLPFTACVRWARLQAAMHTVRDGGTLTAAAHAAGFADSAHLTRVFHAMFGLAPSTAIRHLTWHMPESAEPTT
ncbi:helix-turn-helix domain-containing protein [Actinomadura sp. 6N118]|uniref:helix-turn-helix domain-containing protein n=1 Tax=Actinomadura sp. 6N118 TaxID=3375151 RepID=UPI003792311C